MTELSTPAYIASVAVLAVLIGFLVALESDSDFAKILRRQTKAVADFLWPVVGLPLQVAFVLAGITAWMGAHVGLILVSLFGLLVCLWSQGLKQWSESARDRLKYYLEVKRAHIPEH